MVKLVGIRIIDRIKEAGLTQGILSKHSSVITTRLGFHEVTESVCSREAYIILHLREGENDSAQLISDLDELVGIELRKIDFSSGKEENKIEQSSMEILCILVERNQETIASVQKTLTAFGCNIRTRLGVNEYFFNEPAGLIILELTGDNQQRILLEKELSALEKVHVRAMNF
jgi:hypothetical protein